MARVVVVGAGLTGLAFAYQLRWRQSELPTGLSLRVLEASPRPGGGLRSIPLAKGGVRELGPDGFEGNEAWTLALIARLGLSEGLIQAPDGACELHVFSDGALRPWPASPRALLSLPGLSTRGRLQILRAPMAPDAPVGLDEGLGAFFRRHLGAEAGGRLAAIFAEEVGGDADMLSARSTFPELTAQAEAQGSLLKAGVLDQASRGKTGAGEQKGGGMLDQVLSLFAANAAEAGMRKMASGSLGSAASNLTTLRGGLEAIPRAIADEPGVTVGAEQRVTAILGHADGRLSGPYRVRFQTPRGEEEIEADGVFCALPAQGCADLLAEVDPGLSAALRAIPQTYLTEVVLTLPAALAAQIPGRGYVVPRGEGLRHRRATWRHNAFPQAEGDIFLRVFFGGVGEEDVHEIEDDALGELATREVSKALGVPLTPRGVEVRRRAQRIPQYAPGHGARLSTIERRLTMHPGLLVGGPDYRGISLGDCLRDLDALSDRMIGALLHGQGRRSA